MNYDEAQKLTEVHTDVVWIKANLAATISRVEELEASRNRAVGANAVLSLFISAFISWIWTQMGGAHH